MDLTDGKYMHWSFIPTGRDPLPVQNSYHAVWLWLGQDRWPQTRGATGPHVIVVMDTGDEANTAERVGVGGIWEESCAFFGADGVQKPRMSGPALFSLPGEPVRVNWSTGVWLEGPGMFPKVR
jgi:hypothetical protein